MLKEKIKDEISLYEQKDIANVSQSIYDTEKILSPSTYKLIDTTTTKRIYHDLRRIECFISKKSLPQLQRVYHRFLKGN